MITRKMLEAGVKAYNTTVSGNVDELFRAIYEAMETARNEPEREDGFYWVFDPKLNIMNVMEWHDGYWYLTGSESQYLDTEFIVKSERLVSPASDMTWLVWNGTGTPPTGLVDIRLRNGQEFTSVEADEWQWAAQPNPAYDIVEYRLVTRPLQSHASIFCRSHQA